MMWEKPRFKAVLVWCCIIVIMAQPVYANPSFPLNDAGTTGIPGSGSSASVYQMDDNRDDLRFTYEYVYIRIGDVMDFLPRLNATYVITNSGNNWINQTIAIPGLDICNDTTIRVNDISQSWWYEWYVHMDQQWQWDSYGCYLFNLTFGPRESLTVDIECPIKFHVYFDSYLLPEPGNISVRYIVMTGNSWTGGIGEADIVVEFDNEFLYAITNYSLDNPTYLHSASTTTIRYHNSSWHPDTDLFVSWTPKNWPFNTTVSAGGNDSFRTGESILLELNSTIDTVGGVKYRCDWGDGTATNWSENTTLIHNYSSPGDYAIKVWSMDYFYKVVSDQPIILSVSVEDAQVQSAPGNSIIYLVAGIGAIIIVSLGLLYYHKKKS